jgi:hypothetical protein
LETQKRRRHFSGLRSLPNSFLADALYELF